MAPHISREGARTGLNISKYQFHAASSKKGSALHAQLDESKSTRRGAISAITCQHTRYNTNAEINVRQATSHTRRTSFVRDDKCLPHWANVAKYLLELRQAASNVKNVS